MFLRELFDSDSGHENETLEVMRSQLMDYLIPLAASREEFVPIQQVALVLKQARTGLVVDRGLIMKLCDPNENKLVKSVEGDKVYLQYPTDEVSAHSEDDVEKNKEHVQQQAGQVAQQEVKNQ